VVCFPSSHEGGALLVRHHGQTVEFDWSLLSSSQIQWAAFYSDCEHEITRVSGGHRITLTYNLLITEPIGASLLPNPIVEPSNFPLYVQIKDMLEQPSAFKDGTSCIALIDFSCVLTSSGGVLGFFCSHSYAHTSNTAAVDLPRKLKGSDIVLFSVLQSLGLLVEVLPVLEVDGHYVPPEREQSYKGYLTSDYCFDSANLKIFREKGYMVNENKLYSYGPRREVDEKDRVDFHLSYTTLCSYHVDCKDIETRWKTLLMSRCPVGINTAPGSVVGKKLHPRISTDWGGEGCSSDEVGDPANMI
jgi:hypothetical protein